MSGSKLHCRCTLALVLATFVGANAMATTEKANLTGEQVYRKQCMDCHGASGEGVKDEYEEALFGDWSIGKLARYVTKNMPEEKPKLCVDKDAAKVAKYIHARTRRASPLPT